jgi:hypothetical protein
MHGYRVPVVVEKVEVDEEMESSLWGQGIVEQGCHRPPDVKAKRLYELKIITKTKRATKYLHLLLHTHAKDGP